MIDYRSILKEICGRKEYDDQQRDIGVIMPGVCMQELREYQDRTGRKVMDTLRIGGCADHIVSNALDYSDFKGNEQYEYILWIIRNVYALLFEQNKNPMRFFALAEQRIKDIPDAYLEAIRRTRKELRL